MGESETATVRVIPDISAIPAAEWDACANHTAARYNPFVSHAFLKALEDAGCVGPSSGWHPAHLALQDDNDVTIACMPAYLKTHSRGEYIFDHAWADAYHRAGGVYYPKLQCSVPFTPVPGPRLLVKPGPDADERERILASAAIEFARRQKLSSLHITFLEKDAWKRLGQFGLLQRTDQQFHWPNDGYATFDDFLATLSSRKRKAIRKERAQALESGLEIERLTGGDIKERHWDAFYEFYQDTGARKWGVPYLNRAFFSLLGDTMADDCLLVMVRNGERYVAGALNIIGGDCLYGRYWGAIEHHPFLHFEVCYYQAIDYAIANGLKRVEAGAQGEHKLARGYMPTTTYSLHWIADPGLESAIARYLIDERRHIAHAQTVLADFAPYKKDATSTIRIASAADEPEHD